MKPHASRREANATTFPPLTPALSPLRGEGASRRRMFSNCRTFHHAGKKMWVMIRAEGPGLRSVCCYATKKAAGTFDVILRRFARFSSLIFHGHLKFRDAREHL